MAGRKVLVVDDEKLIVKGIRFSLEQDNMEVDCAYDGEEALEKLRANEYDMVPMTERKPCRWRVIKNMTLYCWMSCYRS